MILTLEKDVLVDSLVQKLDFDPSGGLFLSTTIYNQDFDSPERHFEPTASSIIVILTLQKGI